MSEHPAQKYPVVIRILHWLMALIILGLIAVGYWMVDLPRDYPDRGYIYGLHKSFGVLIIILVLLRFATRLLSKIPALPRTIPKTVRMTAYSAHYILYLLMFCVPFLGYYMSNAYGYGVSLFGITLPKIFPANKELAVLTNDWHAYLAYTLLAIVVLHVAGALKHRFFEKPENNVLKRML